MTDRTRKQKRPAVDPVDSGVFLQSVLDALSAHIAVIDDSGHIVVANAAWHRYGETNGLDSETAGVGINYLEICDSASGEWAEEGKEVASHIRAILAGECTEYHRAYPCHSPDEKRWFQVRLTRFKDRAGVKVVAAHESVTEIKNAEEAVRQSEERFRAVFETAQDLMFIKDANLRYTLVNPSVERLLGIEAGKIIGRRAEDLFGREAGQHIRAGDLRVLEGQTIEEEFTKPVNGAELTFLDTRVPLRDCDGKTTGMCVISRDITERRRAQRPLAKTAETYSSKVMQATLKRALRAAATESTILLLGESGCGKDYLARWIHGHSKRARGPFFSINCAAVSKELAESELFGHEAGAFTGARARKKGLLELAEGGTLLLNDDLQTIFRVNDLLNRAGMDTISCGAAVAFAIECFENDILTTKDTDGLELRWGDGGAIIKLTEMMIKRQGIGDILADGVKLAAERIGQGSEAFAVHCGGMEAPMHDPKFDPGVGMAYSCEPAPGRHSVSSYMLLDLERLDRLFRGAKKTPAFMTAKERYRYDNKGEAMAVGSFFRMLVDASGACTFGTQVGADIPLIQWLNAATGWNLSDQDYLVIGERIEQLRHAFNVREGLNPSRDFRLHPRISGHPPLDKGPAKGVSLDLEGMAEAFYKAMGWDLSTGLPDPERLERLKLDEVVAALHPNRSPRSGA